MDGKGGLRFGSSKKLEFDGETRQKIAVPGPGTYAIDNLQTRNKQPLYSMGARSTSVPALNPEKNPSPGQYNSDSSFVKQKAPAYG